MTPTDSFTSPQDLVAVRMMHMARRDFNRMWLCVYDQAHHISTPAKRVRDFERMLSTWHGQVDPAFPPIVYETPEYT